MAVSQVVMCWLDSRSPHGHLLLAAVHTHSNIPALMTNCLLIPSCLPLPSPMPCGALGGTNSRWVCYFLPILPVEKWQPATCFPYLLCLHFSVMVREVQTTSVFWEAHFKGNAALLGMAVARLLAAFYACRLAGQELLSALLAKFSPLHHATAAAVMARPTRHLSEEEKLLGAKSQLPEAKRAGAGRCSTAKRCSRAWSKGCLKQRVLEVPLPWIIACKAVFFLEESIILQLWIRLGFLTPSTVFLSGTTFRSIYVSMWYLYLITLYQTRYQRQLLVLLKLLRKISTKHTTYLHNWLQVYKSATRCNTHKKSFSWRTNFIKGPS